MGTKKLNKVLADMAKLAEELDIKIEIQQAPRHPPSERMPGGIVIIDYINKYRDG